MRAAAASLSIYAPPHAYCVTIVRPQFVEVARREEPGVQTLEARNQLGGNRRQPKSAGDQLLTGVDKHIRAAHARDSSSSARHCRTNADAPSSAPSTRSHRGSTDV